MIKGLLTVALLCIYQTVSAQQITVTNYLTERYRDIPMTKLSLLLSDGFVWDTLEYEYRDDKRSLVLRTEEVQNSLANVWSQFFSRFFLVSDVRLSDSNGYTLYSNERFRINGIDAVLCRMTVSDDMHDDINHTWLFIGDSARTYVVKMIGGRGEVVNREIQSMLLSTIYDPSRVLLRRGGDPTVTSSSSCKCNDKR